MKRYLAFIALLLPLVAFAAPASDFHPPGWDELTPLQQTEVLKAIELTSKANSKAEDVPSIKEVDEWVNVGERIGKMLNGAAREVGMALSTFITTPAGKVALALIVWKVAGTAVVHLVGAFMVWGIGAVVMTALYLRYSRVEITYDPERKNIFGRPLKKKEVIDELTSDQSWGLALGSAAFTMAGLIVLLSM